MAWLRSVVDAIPSPALFLSPSGDILAFNSETQRICGWQREDALGKSYFDLLSLAEDPTVVATTKAEMKKALAGEPTGKLEHRIVDGTGRQRALSWNLARMLNAQGRPAGIIAIGQEVTAREQPLEDWTEAQTELRAVLLDASLVCMVLVDWSLLIRGFNKTANQLAQTILGKELVRGRSVLDYVDRRHFEAFRGQFAPALRGQTVSVEQRVALTGKADAWFEFNFVPVPRPEAESESGEAKGVMVFAVDITERKRAEQALRESEATLRAIFENMEDVYFRANLDGTLQLISPAIERYGYRAADLIGTDVRSLCQDPADWDPMEIMREQGAVNDAELLARCRDGTLVPTSVTAHLLRDPDGRPIGVEGVARDIAERKRAEAAAREHEAELAHALRVSTMGAMAAELAHELNQPLAAIANYASGCALRMQPDKPELAGCVGAMHEISAEVFRSREILRRISGFLHKGDAQRQRYDVNGLVRNVAQIVAAEARQRDVTVRLDLAPQLPSVEVDGVQIEQVIINLVQNGFDAMSDGHRGEPAVVISTTWNEGSTIEVAVRDSGTGFPEAVAGKAFEPFFSTKSSGLGMGLAISRSIVEGHGGNLWATPTNGGGTTFRFTLPVAAGGHPPASG